MGAAGRACAAQGCGTVLRRDNLSVLCELHQRMRREPPALSWWPPSLDPAAVLVPASPRALTRRLARIAP